MQIDENISYENCLDTVCSIIYFDLPIKTCPENERSTGCLKALLKTLFLVVLFDLQKPWRSPGNHFYIMNNLYCKEFVLYHYVLETLLCPSSGYSIFTSGMGLNVPSY